MIKFLLMNKKSQVSVFIIIGLVIIIISALVYFKFNEPNIKINEKNEFEKINEHIQECIQDSTIEAIELLGQQGSLNPSAYVASDNTKISYYYFKGKGYLPDQDSIESQISLFVKEHAYDCINEFSDKDYVVDVEIIEISTEIKNDYVVIKLESPVKVYHHGKKDEISIPEIELTTNLKKIYDTSKGIITDTIRDPNWIQFDKLYENELDIKIIKVNSSTIVYVITDNKVGLNKEPYTYRFAVKYDL